MLEPQHLAGRLMVLGVLALGLLALQIWHPTLRKVELCADILGGATQH